MEGAILDQAHDVAGREIHRLTSLYAQPEYVKQASHERLCGDPASQLPNTYAEPRNKLYPCHTAAATWMSALFFNEKRASFPAQVAARIEENLQRSAVFFGIAPDLSQLQTKMAADAASDVARLADDDFAIIWEGANGTKERHWPLRNATEVRHAAGQLTKNAQQFTFEDRHRIANRLLEKSISYGANLEGHSETLHKMAGFGSCASSTVADYLDKRAKLTAKKLPDFSVEMAKLATQVRQFPAQARDHDCRVKMASTLDQFDRATGLDKLYGNGLELPEDVLFQVTEKVAQEFTGSHVATLTGNIYPLAAIEKLAIAQIRNVMGEEFADAVTNGGFVDSEKVAAIVPTLDRLDARLFDQLMKQVQITPEIQEKDASVKPLQTADLLQMAADYQPAARQELPRENSSVLAGLL